VGRKKNRSDRPINGHPRRTVILPIEKLWVGRVDHGKIRSEGRSRRGPQMSATPDSTLNSPEQRIADLERQLAECKAERDEALRRETATAEVLQVINSSPGDLAPVFEAMLDKATHLCEASYGMLYRYDGDLFRAVALHAVPTAFADFLREPFRADSRNALGRLVGGERLVHMPDLREDAAYFSGEPLRMATVELGGARTYLGVPLRKDGVLLGAIGAYRQEVRPFSEKQITLLEALRHVECRDRPPKSVPI
jgi:hypothetical protein